jgi:hypothetical protein
LDIGRRDSLFIIIDGVPAVFLVGIEVNRLIIRSGSIEISDILRKVVLKG